MDERETVELKAPVRVVLPNGEQYLLRPGPYGKGIAVSALEGRAEPLVKTAPGTGRRGRKPRASTIRLRKRLEKDAAGKGLRDNPTYVRWLLSQDDTISLAVARQVVYRERRNYT